MCLVQPQDTTLEYMSNPIQREKMKMFKVSNYDYVDYILAMDKISAEAEFIYRNYPTKLDDDLPDLEIEVEEANEKTK